MTKAKAESVLLFDLGPYIAMVNDKVFAPISQGQFDALVSLAFNIGPKRFMESDVLRALNNGRILDAASGFDVWRRAKINGESYVVDALVRRRTAEKILFLRPEAMPLRAPRFELKAAADAQIAALQTHAGERIYEEDGMALTVPYEKTQERRSPESAPAGATLMRRREDHARGVLTLSEVYDEGDLEDSAPLDFAEGPLVENAQDFSLDIDGAPNTEAPFDDALQTNNIQAKNYQAENYQAETLQAETLQDGDIDYAGFDPDRDIVPSETGAGENKGEGEAMDMQTETGSPSAIAAAAAEVSGRLDALMAGGADEASKPQRRPLEKSAAKVLPFPSRNAAGPAAEDAQDALKEANPPRADLPEGDSAARFIERGAQSQIAEDIEADEADAAMGLYEDMTADEDIEGAVQASSSSGPLSFMFILGMILGGASLGAILSGYAAKFGIGGEFAASIGVIFGLMLFLGSVYYIFKTRNRQNGNAA